MKKIDLRFSETVMNDIKSIIGKEMIKYKCDPFEFSTSVYGIVGVEFEGTTYAISNLIEVMDYYGEQEDIAVLKIKQVPFSEIQSLIQNQT